ncbi:MAG: hypothetical protein JW749_00050 [Sedimentisphaerales bacterium]|nr:hypothetical protein [Sedimentisphaerales bacterium]
MKKYEILTNLIIAVIILNFSKIAFGFGNKLTHPALTNSITEGAVVDSYLKNQLGMSNGIQTQLKYQPDWYQMYIEYRLKRGDYSLGGNNRQVFEWMKAGSVIEDEDLEAWYFFPSIRPRHHFHDPINNVGLDNKYDHPNYSKLFAWATHFYPAEFDVTGQSAKTWAIKGYAQQGPTDNIQCWDDTRENFYSALTDPKSLWREYWLSATFLDLGSIMHLIEDMGVPAHTRNDFLFGHYQPPLGFGNDFENWVERIVGQNGGQCPWSGSGPVAFDKLTKYFDANAYAGDYLGDGILPPNIWGFLNAAIISFCP